MINTNLAASRDNTVLRPVLPILFLLVAIVGLGIIYGISAHQWSVRYLTPAIFGMGAGWILAFVLWQIPVRRRVFALLLAALTAVGLYATFQVTGYFLFRQTSINELMQRGMDSQQAVMVVDDLLSENGSTSILGYLNYRLKSGVTVRTNMLLTNQISGSQLLLDWLFDFGLICLAVGFSAWKSVERRYCADCDHYYGYIALTSGEAGYEIIGYVKLTEADTFAQSIQMDHLERAGALIAPKKGQGQKDDLIILIERCVSCNNSPVFLSLKGKSSSSNAKRPTLFHAELTRAQWDRLISFSSYRAKQRQLHPDLMWLLSFSLVWLFLFGLLLVGRSFFKTL